MVINDKVIFILERIIGYCDEINETNVRFYRDFNLFLSDSVYRNACCMCVLQIGELIGKLPNEFKQKYSNVDWERFYLIRNMYAHAYDTIKLELAWKTIQVAVPKLRNQCVEIMKELEEKEKNIEM